MSKLTSNIYKIDAANESDHDTMKIVIQNRMDYPNKAQWYMNNELTDNPKYVEEFTKEWNKKWTNSISKLGQWEQIKIWIRNFTIKWIKENKTNPNTEISLHIKKLKRYKKSIKELGKRCPPLEEAIARHKNAITKELEKQSKMKHETYSQLRNLHYEKANKPYFGLERKMRMKNDRVITEMKAYN